VDIVDETCGYLVDNGDNLMNIREITAFMPTNSVDKPVDTVDESVFGCA